MCVCSQLGQSGAWYKRNYDHFIGNRSPCAKVVHLCGSGITVALLIIGILSVTGVFSVPNMGWTTLGLGGGYIAVKLLGGDLSKRKIDVISAALIAALIMTFGALGGAGVLSGVHVGYAQIGVALATGVLTIGLMLYAPAVPTNPLEPAQSVE